MIGGQATRRWISRAPPRSRISCTRARIVVERTMLSSTRRTRLPARTSGKRRVLEPGLGGAVGGALDERPADVAVAHQALDRGDAQREGHRVGGGLGRVGHRHDDRVGVERHVLQPRQLLAQGRPAQVDRAVVERAGDVGEVDPLEEAMRLARRRRRTARSARPWRWPRPACPGSSERIFRKPEVGQRHALAGRAEERAVLGDAERAEPQRVADHHQVAVRREQHDVVRAVEPLGDPAEDADPVGLLVLGLELVGSASA